jgi:hypothetical protein
MPCLERFAISLLGVVLVYASSSSQATPLAPAFETKSATSEAGAPLFFHEQVQLTQVVVNNLATQVGNATAALFQFASSNDSDPILRSRSSEKCKLLPGDLLWPTDFIWDIFDLLLGRALIKTVPLASPCYTDQFGERNNTECSYISSQWTNSNFQSV